MYGTGTLLRLDARTGRVTRRITVGASACRIALAGNAAWVTRDRAGKVVRVDLRTGRQRAIAIGGVPFDVMHAAGAIWVTSFDNGTVVRLDMRTGRLRGVSRVGKNPAGLAYCARACLGRAWPERFVA